MLTPNDPRPAEWADELDALISTAYSDADVEAATTALVAEADALENAVELPAPFTFTLTGRNGTIEIRLGNTSDEPLNVTMHLESSKVEFPDGDQQVTLRPNDETSDHRSRRGPIERNVVHRPHGDHTGGRHDRRAGHPDLAGHRLHRARPTAHRRFHPGPAHVVVLALACQATCRPRPKTKGATAIPRDAQ